MFLDRIAECEKAIQIAAFYAHYIRPSCLPYHTIWPVFWCDEFGGFGFICPNFDYINLMLKKYLQICLFSMLSEVNLSKKDINNLPDAIKKPFYIELD